MIGAEQGGRAGPAFSVSGRDQRAAGSGRKGGDQSFDVRGRDEGHVGERDEQSIGAGFPRRQHRETQRPRLPERSVGVYDDRKARRPRIGGKGAFILAHDRHAAEPFELAKEARDMSAQADAVQQRVDLWPVSEAARSAGGEDCGKDPGPAQGQASAL